MMLHEAFNAVLPHLNGLQVLVLLLLLLLLLQGCQPPRDKELCSRGGTG